MSRANFGCFGPDSTVLVLRGGADHKTRVADVVAGDQVRVKQGLAKVACVVQSQHDEQDLLVQLPSGPALTKTHPVKLDGQWQPPPVAGATRVAATLVYNFVLEPVAPKELLPSTRLLRVDGVECVTYGHGLQVAGAAHAYYGTDAVLEDLRKLPGWAKGLVQVAGCERDAKGNVLKLLPAQDELSTAASDGPVRVDEDAEVPDVTVEVCQEGDKCLVRCVVPEPEARGPVDICCVVDVSGSMGSKATYETPDGQIKDDGLTVLDVVKHACRAVIGGLNSQDRVALVAFDTNAETVLPLTLLDGTGKTKAEAALSALRPRSQTNLWGGLQHGLDALRELAEPPCDGLRGRPQTLMLLTDGQPNLSPPKGELEELKNYQETHPDFACQINTFGFGYNLDSQLLLGLASEGAGSFAFIPAAPMVGTNFVDTLANVLSNHTPRAKLHLSAKGGQLGDVLGFPTTAASWGTVVDLGPLQFGQQREVVVSCAPGAKVEAVLEYGDQRSFGAPADLQGAVTAAVTRAVSVAALEQACALGLKRQAANGLARIEQCAKQVDETLASAPAEAREQIQALLEDLRGRAAKALTGQDRFQRWGRHYLRALKRSHELQHCTNFTDPGVQVYGGRFFAQLRKEGDENFLTLPPPKPANPQPARVQSSGYARAAPAPSAPAAVDMNHYYDRFGGCFAATSTVLVAGQRKPVSEVRRGDALATATGLARVVCVVQGQQPVPVVQMPNGPALTARHPVRVGGAWQLPQGDPAGDKVVYNFVLEREHVLLVDGVECATLGHGLQEPGVRHEYYGGRILNDLARLPGWEDGFVQVGACVRVAGRIEALVAPVAAC